MVDDLEVKIFGQGTDYIYGLDFTQTGIKGIN